MAAKKRSRGAIRANGNGNDQSNGNNSLAQAPLPPQRNGNRSHHNALADKMDPKETARLIKKIPVDPSTQIVRHLAIFRIIIFLLLIYTYVKYLPHFELNRHVDSWLTYDQFGFFYNWAPKQGDTWATFCSLSILTCAVFFGMLSALGGVNGVNNSYEVSGGIFLSCFAFRFFTFAHNFTDRHYLLFLLGVITVVSGGGSFFLIFTEVDPHMSQAAQQFQRQRRQHLIQSSEWGAITLRMQFAVVYLFSSFWKLHADYFQGHILRSHLIGMDPYQYTRPSWFWHTMEGTFGPAFFQIIGMVAFLMDFGMFLALTFRRPTEETARSFVLYSLLFHFIVALSIGHKLGYSFSIVCMVGTLIFYPIGGGSKAAMSETDAGTTTDQNAIKKRIRNRSRASVEANLMHWAYRYATASPEARATRKQQMFTLVWLLVQLALPLRMPLISGGNYPFTGQGSRFSWTMMLHSRQTTINHVGKYSNPLSPSSPVAEKLVPMHLFYVALECDGHSLQRRDYMPERAVATEDPRTLPVDSVLTDQHKNFVRSYPRYMSRVAGGMSMLLNRKLPEACGNSTQVAAYGVHFAKLNGRGAYSRIFDPTVDLIAAETTRHHRSVWEKIWGVLLDKSPEHEFVLSSGIGTMDRYIDLHSASIGMASLGAQRVELVADRAACLFLRPLALWPNGYPLAIMPLEAPSNVDLLATIRVHSEAALANLTITAGNQFDVLDPPQTAALKMGHVSTVSAVSLEVSARYKDNFFPGENGCADTTAEDILFALFFMS